MSARDRRRPARGETGARGGEEAREVAGLGAAPADAAGSAEVGSSGSAGAAPIGPTASASAAGTAPDRPRPRRRFRLPLAFVVGRYFVYILLGALLTVGGPLLGLDLLISWGAVLSADDGATRVQQVMDGLIGEGAFDASEVPESLRYAHLSADATEVLETDMSGDLLVKARALARTGVYDAEPPAASELTSAGSYTCMGATRADGTWVMLAYDLMPQWADRARRDAWPNPQDLALAAAGASTVVLVVLVALRANRVLTRKMAPLVETARSVGARELDRPAGTSNVAQVDDVLSAMDEMRRSLKRSLEEQWAADERQRAQIAALAHDLKTPLTVIRGNAELLVEDLRGVAGDEGSRPAGGAVDAPTADEGNDQLACAQAVLAASLTTDAYVAQIIAASREDAAAGAADRAPIDLDVFARRLEAASRDLARAEGATCEVARSAAFDASAAKVRPAWDADRVERAVLNLVANACAYGGGTVHLDFDVGGTERPCVVIAVEDDGPGFTVEALAHARERLWRGDAARTAAGSALPHAGLGLATADEAARDHGGALVLANRTDSTGAVLGACVTLRLSL